MPRFVLEERKSRRNFFVGYSPLCFWFFLVLFCFASAAGIVHHLETDWTEPNRGRLA